MTGSAAQQSVLCGKILCDRVSFQAKIMRQGINIDKKIMRQGIYRKESFWRSLGTIDHVYFWQNFYVTRYPPCAFLMRQGIGCEKFFCTHPSLL